MENCANCKASLKGNAWSTNAPVDVNTVTFIDGFKEDKKGGYCIKCAKKVIQDLAPKVNKEIKELEARMMATIDTLPIVSTHSPADWDYESIGVVTGQSVLGSGLLGELSAGVSEIFGSTSNVLNEKIRTGENNCYLQIKKQALERGGNAILALDIDYNEMGGKGLIMVCMTGTAIILRNSKTSAENIDFLQCQKRFRYLKHMMSKEFAA